jgi:hypothetical protein
MLDITNFLQKFLKFEKDNNTKLSIILDVIKQTTGIESSKEALEIKGDNLCIKCNPVLRNEIFMHKCQIEDQLKISKIFLKIV